MKSVYVSKRSWHVSYCIWLSILSLASVHYSFAQAPTTGASGFSVTLNSGNNLRVNWTRGNGGNVLVVASASSTFNGTGTPADGTDYTASTILGSGNQVGTGNFAVYRGTGTNVTITGLSHSTQYYFRIYEFNGTGTGTFYNTTNVLAGSGTTSTPPATGSTNLIATPTGNSASLTWTRGDGARVLVILQQGSATTDPTQYANYSASTTFGSGSAVGSGYVIYSNTSNTVAVTNLQPNTQYFYRVVEANGTATGPVYNLATALTGSFTTGGAPTAGASAFVVNNPDGDRVRVNWARGNGSNVLVIASLSPTFSGGGVPANGTDYVESAVFGAGDQIGSGNFAVYRGTSTSVTVTGLTHSTTYYFRIYEFNGTNFNTFYNTTNVLAGNGSTLFPPTVGSTNFTATPTGNTASLSWTRGNGTRTLVILQQGSATSDPTQYTNYSPSTTFGNGSAVGSGRVVYYNTGNTVNVTNLVPNTQYFYRIVESNGPSGPVFNLAAALTGSFTTAGAPTTGSTAFSVSNIQGNQLTMSFTRGNGTQRLIVARQDNPVLFTPVNGVDYNSNVNFGSGDNLGNQTFAIAETINSTVIITGLTPATTYHISVFEFNGTATNTFYLTDPAKVLTGSATTLSPPGTSAGNFSFTNINGNSARVTFTAGNGVSRIVLAKAGSAVTDIPVTLTQYNFSTGYFSSAPALGTSKIVYNGSGLTFDLDALEPGTTYHFAIFEYNGSSGPVYKQADPGIGSFTTQTKPTVAPTAITFANIQGDRMNMSMTTGNGFGRMIIAKLGAPVDRFPVDGITYNANSSFGNVTTSPVTNGSSDLGNGNYIIQNNSSVGGSTSSGLTNLAIGQVYYFAIIEYNGTGTQRVYMDGATEALVGSSSTLSAPTVQATNVTFSNITSNTVTVNWQNGNGTARIVILRDGAPVATLPTNLINYSSSGYYPSSPALGTGKIIYNGTGTSINVTDIPPGTYHVAIIEYNGTTYPVYRNVDPLVATVNVGAKPIVAATNLTFSNIQGNQITLSCTAGDGISRMLVAKQGSAVDAWPVDFTGYTVNTSFGNGSNLGNGNFVVGSTIYSSFTVSNLQPNTTYHFAVVEFNGTGTNTYYQDQAIVAKASSSTLTAPTVTTSSFFSNNITGNRMQLTWTKGDGAGRLIIAKAGAAVDAAPVNLTNYSQSSNFGSGSNLGGGNFAVYDGTSDNFTLTNMEPGTTYHFAYFEYNGSTGKVYLQSPVARSSFTTASRPSVAPKNLAVSGVNGDRFNLSLTPGNGTRFLIVLRKGGLVNEVPIDLTTYTTGAFGSGSQLGTGNYVTTVGNNLSPSAAITGLEPDTPYGVAVFEIDGSNGNQRYLVTDYINQIVRTSAPPTITTNALLYNSLGSTSINLSWTNGNGEGRMVVLRPAQPVTFIPTVLSTHPTASSNYTSTSNNLPNGHKHIQRGALSTVTITNLTPGTTYHVAIYEYNGPTQPVYTSVPLRGFFTTLPTSGVAIGGFDAITFCPLQQVDVPYVFTGVLNAGNQVSVELSSITGSFASPTVLGVQATTNSTGFVTSTLPASIAEGIGYRLRVKTTNASSVSADNGVDLQIATSVQPAFTVVGGQVSTCGNPIQLTTSQPNYNLQWFRNSQPIPFATASTYSATQSGSYQVRISGASGGCQLLSPATALTISNAPVFDLQFAPQYCINSVIDLTPLAKPAGGTLSGNGITNGIFNTAAAGIGQHFVTYTYTDAVSLCTYSETTYIKVTAIPAAPTVTGNTGCANTSMVLTASGASAVDSYQWYTVATGGTPIAGQTTAAFTTPVITTTTNYYVSILSASGCPGPRTLVTATVTPGPAAPSVNSASAFTCGTGAVTLTAAGGSNGQYRWYNVATGGIPIANEVNGTYTTPSLTTTTNYYVALNDGTCESTRTLAVATVRASCANSAPVITASAFATTIQGRIQIELISLITDEDDNLNLSTLKIVSQPISGAPAAIDANLLLTIDYADVSFSGADKLTIEICDMETKCTQQELTIEVAGEVEVYNAVSPNGDQKNDFLFLQYIELLPETKINHVTIVNRWGSVVWEGDNYNNTSVAFQGQSNSGNELPSGNYFYKIEFDSGRKNKSGFFTLKR